MDPASLKPYSHHCTVHRNCFYLSPCENKRRASALNSMWEREALKNRLDSNESDSQCVSQSDSRPLPTKSRVLRAQRLRRFTRLAPIHISFNLLAIRTLLRNWEGGREGDDTRMRGTESVSAESAVGTRHLTACSFIHSTRRTSSLIGQFV